MPTHMVAFLVAMSEGQNIKGALPSWLLREASKVVYRFQDTVLPEDVVQAFLESLVAEGKNNRARVPWHLHSDAAAMGLVRRRMRQLACELGDNWNFERALRNHVRGALDDGLPPPPNEPPFTVCDGGRLSRVLVAQAGAWLVAREHVAANLRDVTRALKVRYHFQTAVSDSEDETVESTASAIDDELPDEQAEARELAGWLVHELGPEMATVLGLRLADHKLATVGNELGIAMTTVHDKERKAKAVVKRFIQEYGCSPQVAGRALRRLIETVA